MSVIERPSHRHWWWQVLLSGVVIFYALERVAVQTKNVNLVPSVILFGAFVVPATFVLSLYQRLSDWDVPIPVVLVTFVWGGALGVLVASLLEYDTLRRLGILPMLGVGLIEEAAKLIVPVFFYLRGRYRSKASGLVIGVAAGMGFAALETMGYAFVTLLRSGGNLAALDGVLLLRGLLSPALHASWTGVAAAVLWKQRERGRPGLLSGTVVGTYLLVAVLHAVWDTFNSVDGVTSVHGVSLFEGLSLLVAALSLGLLLRKVREARQPLPRALLSGASVVRRARP